MQGGLIGFELMGIWSIGLLRSNMTEQEQEQIVFQELQYMIAEGTVVEVKPGHYRLKTERELEEEMKAFL